jgi:hypothetical protein
MKLLFLATALFAFMGCATSNCGCGQEANPHLSLNLGPNWSCEKQDLETVCKERAKSDRVIIWSVKEKGPTDSQANYRKTLSEKRRHELNGRAFESIPISIQSRAINGQIWIDAVQFQSELPNYSTRYLAAVDDDYAVLVTFSAERSSFDQFSKDMQPLVDTLVIRH